MNYHLLFALILLCAAHVMFFLEAARVAGRRAAFWLLIGNAFVIVPLLLCIYLFISAPS